MSTRRPGRPSGPTGQHGKEAILEAARALLGELGTTRVTLRSVAERAGVRPPLVNYYFGSKDELFEAVIEEVAEGLRDQLVDIAQHEGTPEERLRAALAGLIRGLADNPFAPRLMAELVIFPDDERTERFVREFGGPNLAALTRIVEAGVAGGDFGSVDWHHLAPAIFGTCIFYFLSAPVLRRLLDFEPLAPQAVERYAQFAGDLLLHGIAAHGGE